MKNYFIIIIAFSLSSLSIGQINQTTTDSLETIPSFQDDFISAYNTGIRIITKPSEFDLKDWITLGSVAALTSSAFLIDNENRNFWLRNKSAAFDKVAEIGRIYGDITYAAIFSASLYLSGKIVNNKNLSVTGRMLIEGLFYAGLTTTIIKTVSGRSRPFTNEGDFKFRFFQTKNDFTSFPSGHTTVAFTLSTILSERINNTYATILLYSLAGTTTLQRMYSDNHWLSDTILGASIGYFIGKAVLLFDDDANSNLANKFFITPGFSEGVMTFNISYFF
ncbi:Phosphoesterase PA-phosphatase-like protein [Ignavibacterium album JCM 16511]|uniref:Phosphoesterase PA-phosphatase-like protein n=1 Tax=Ignavibacterium album (strain DSM 19864 / JCM 16511 / NBRC 101810 / Mat9-16) TaxID=945713 RepID=I0AHT8_IGNAJ|nr:phosphatase PAP2 family protein [Ignavibacterium album]AFH48545.1 Phosphoesterase PA-phosphatase-like protein [Ignavibacterium album JCM 16511]